MPLPWPLPERATAPPSPAWLLADLGARAFGHAAPRRRRIGAELEAIPLHADTGAPVPIHPPPGGGIASLPLLREHALRERWTERAAPGGAVSFAPPQGGMISYEPGGQIEYSSPPCETVDQLLRVVRRVVEPLRRAAAAGGIRLLFAGIDPRTPVEAVPLQLGAPRYARMAEHFARIGPAGARMMRQTASLQVNLDWDGDAHARWRLLNAAAPLLVAIFANSPVYQGAPTGARSYRARVWRELDPTRTGVLDTRAEPEAAYLEMALGADALLKLDRDATPRPFGWWVRRGEATEADWALHLTTLFPEVRAKGFAEIRSLDSLDPEWLEAPLVLLAGLVYCPGARAEAAALLGPSDPALLARAGEQGLGDPWIASRAADLVQLGLTGAARLPGFVGADALERAEAFFQRFTLRARSPGDG